jgi:membrane protease YdiL (CAAX protease family)
VRHWIRLPAGIGLTLLVVALASGVATEVPAVRALNEAHAWLRSGDVIQVVFLVSSLALMLAFTRGHPSAYGLRGARPREFGRVLLVAGSFAAVIGVLSAVSVLAGLGGGGGHPSVGGNFLKDFISIWIVASVSEEMLFRGLIQSYLGPLKAHGFRLIRRRVSLPVTVAALAFGLVHLGLLGSAPPPLVATIVVTATILGFIAGYYREKTGSVLPAIAAHFLFNALGSGIPMIAMRLVSR